MTTQQKIEKLTDELKALWSNHRAWDDLTTINAVTDELSELRQSTMEPVTDWRCDSDGQWWI